MESWHEFLVALAGASGALVGLIIVAMSISLDLLMKAPNLISRGAACLELLTGVLLVSCALLMPDLGDQAIGSIILIGGVAIWAVTTASSIRSLVAGGHAYRGRGLFALALFQLATIPQIVAGIAAFRMGADAMYILAIAFIVTFGVAVLDAWVLMIEVRR
ncbi:MAG: hypothetical protein QM753_05480 [Thermomicrobiales bacterium]